MKKLTVLFIVFTLFLSFCKKDDQSDTNLTVNGFYDYCGTDNSCGKPFAKEGDNVSVTGYIQALNTFSSEGRFHIFNSASMMDKRLEIVVTRNNTVLFEKLNRNLDSSNVTNFTKFKVRGKIFGKDLLLIDGSCSRGCFLEINSPENIIVISK